MAEAFSKDNVAAVFIINDRRTETMVTLLLPAPAGGEGVLATAEAACHRSWAPLRQIDKMPKMTWKQ